MKLCVVCLCMPGARRVTIYASGGISRKEGPSRGALSPLLEGDGSSVLPHVQQQKHFVVHVQAAGKQGCGAPRPARRNTRTRAMCPSVHQEGSRRQEIPARANQQ